MANVNRLYFGVAVGAVILTHAAASAQSPTPFTVELVNKLGVKATITVNEFTAGKDFEGGNEHDYITQELNYLGGEWHSQSPLSSDPDVDFQKSMLVIEMGANQDHGPQQFVLIPWQSFRSMSIQGDAQLVTLNDGNTYKGKLRTILIDKSGSEKRSFELGGTTSMNIVKLPVQVAQTNSVSSVQIGTSKGLQWKLSGKGSWSSISGLTISQPRFVYSRFRVTSGGGIFKEDGFFETQVSEQFGVVPNDNAPGDHDEITATINDFESIAFGGTAKDEFHDFTVTVKAKDADAVSGQLVDPFSSVSEYFNRTHEMMGILPNGNTILFILPYSVLPIKGARAPSEFKMQRIYASMQTP